MKPPFIYSQQEYFEVKLISDHNPIDSQCLTLDTFLGYLKLNFVDGYPLATPQHPSKEIEMKIKS